MNDNGYFRVAAAVPEVALADPESNTRRIVSLAEKCASRHAMLAVFPELCTTGYTCADLFSQSQLIRQAASQLSEIADATRNLEMIIAAGAPLFRLGKLYNCAVFIHKGEIIAALPKTYLPNYGEFYEKRWFSSGAGIRNSSIMINGKEIPFGTDILVRCGNAVIGAEICEDLWAPIPVSSYAALAGANVIVNLSASNEVISKHEYLLQTIKSTSARCIAGYVYASAGNGESSTDLSFSGNAIICENGKIAASSERFAHQEAFEIYDLDLEMIDNHRQKSTSWSDCSSLHHEHFRIIDADCKDTRQPGDIIHSYSPTPFVPPAEMQREVSKEIISIQVAGLMQRLRAIRCSKAVVGISGGLDSTLALLVTAEAFDRLGIDRSNIIGITMPGFGTTVRTHTNADSLMDLLGVTSLEIPINNAVSLHFSDIGHDPETKDVTYENSQARERTQILMDYANKINGIVIGTGDLSESALGWATYNGDHMSMYAVNASIPKTLVRYLVEYFAASASDSRLSDILRDIIDTPISPELIPADDKGNIAQKTEELVGPYILHDFFLYHVMRNGFGPKKILAISRIAFSGITPDEEIKKNLTTFFRRFFSQQFKRSCMPDSPKVGNVCLSPRGDWRMPSDASSSLWTDACNGLI